MTWVYPDITRVGGYSYAVGPGVILPAHCYQLTAQQSQDVCLALSYIIHLNLLTLTQLWPRCKIVLLQIDGFNLQISTGDENDLKESIPFDKHTRLYLNDGMITPREYHWRIMVSPPDSSARALFNERRCR